MMCSKLVATEIASLGFQAIINIGMTWIVACVGVTLPS
jgi:hypothetical protein